jgi:hypothetical protein
MNPYKKYLDELFDRIIELRHTDSNLSKTLNESVKRYINLNGFILSGSSLVISDWTGPTDNGWEINFHTGFSKSTFGENYENEVKRIISQECCYAFAQSFEALEKFFKDCIFEKIEIHPRRRFCFQRNYAVKTRRENLGGDRLFKLIRKIGDPYFSSYSSNNNKKLRFKELWTVLSECRHSITHSKSIIAIHKIKKSGYHFEIFKNLFFYSNNGDNSITLELDFKALTYVLDIISEFAFQVYKSISIKEGLDWEIVKK